jgi:hypothetical protein
MSGNMISSSAGKSDLRLVHPSSKVSRDLRQPHAAIVAVCVRESWWVQEGGARVRKGLAFG